MHCRIQFLFLCLNLEALNHAVTLRNALDERKEIKGGKERKEGSVKDRRKECELYGTFHPMQCIQPNFMVNMIIKGGYTLFLFWAKCQIKTKIWHCDFFWPRNI